MVVDFYACRRKRVRSVIKYGIYRPRTGKLEMFVKGTLVKYNIPISNRRWKMRSSATVFCIFECVSGAWIGCSQISYSRHGCILTKAKLLFSPGYARWYYRRDTYGYSLSVFLLFLRTAHMWIINGIYRFVCRPYYTLRALPSILRYHGASIGIRSRLFSSCRVTKIFSSSAIRANSIGKPCIYNKSARYSRQMHLARSLFFYFILINVRLADKNCCTNYIDLVSRSL